MFENKKEREKERVQLEGTIGNGKFHPRPINHRSAPVWTAHSKRVVGDPPIQLCSHPVGIAHQSLSLLFDLISFDLFLTSRHSQKRHGMYRFDIRCGACLWIGNEPDKRCFWGRDCPHSWGLSTQCKYSHSAASPEARSPCAKANFD